jgi:predicted ATPase
VAPRAALRIVLAGGPRTGKTTLAAALGLPVLHTDDLIDRGWVAAGKVAATWLDRPGPWIIEGVTAPRALRRWLRRHRRGAPCDVIVFLRRPQVPRTPGQEAMAKGCATIYEQIRARLLRRGVRELTASALRWRLSRKSVESLAPARATRRRRAAAR